jgi:hypothetical protein
MILIKLILAHLLGDFILQPNSWVTAKEKLKLKAWQLYIHALIHFALVIILVGQTTFFKWALLLTGAHLITDIMKLYFQKDHSKRLWFFIDQLFHFVMIILVWSWSQSVLVIPEIVKDEKFLLLITCVYALTQPVSVLVRNIISRWTPDTNANNSDSLANAGNYIGILERLFVFAFVVTGYWDAIGFLLAAKSIFRFGDLKESKDRKLTEYVLIGTLLSFGIAILIGLIFNGVKIV